MHDVHEKDTRVNVLLVEDSLIDAHLIIAILEAEALYQVTLAQDGMKGALLATEQEWDLVITDLNLPGGSGLTVIANSKEHHPATPILTTTGYTAPQAIQGALRAGADGVLHKPIERDALMERLLYLLGANRASKTNASRRTVLAIGAKPGDVEAGCGGILFGHRDHDQEVVILTLTESGNSDGIPITSSTENPLGAKVLVSGPGEGQEQDAAAVAEVVADAVRAFEPDTVYLPSIHDKNETRLAAHRGGLMGAGQVPNLYCYQTVTSTADFRPSLFVGIEGSIDDKVTLLDSFQEEGDAHPGHSEGHIRAAATYWGRFGSYTDAEPLEVVRSDV